MSCGAPLLSSHHWPLTQRTTIVGFKCVALFSSETHVAHNRRLLLDDLCECVLACASRAPRVLASSVRVQLRSRAVRASARLQTAVTLCIRFAYIKRRAYAICFGSYMRAATTAAASALSRATFPPEKSSYPTPMQSKRHDGGGDANNNNRYLL